MLAAYAILVLTLYAGNNTEKIWTHRFLAKPKTIETGGLGGAVWGPGQCLGERVGPNPLDNFFFLYNMLKW